MDLTDQQREASSQPQMEAHAIAKSGTPKEQARMAL